VHARKNLRKIGMRPQQNKQKPIGIQGRKGVQEEAVFTGEEKPTIKKEEGG